MCRAGGSLPGLVPPPVCAVGFTSTSRPDRSSSRTHAPGSRLPVHPCHSDRTGVFPDAPFLSGPSQTVPGLVGGTRGRCLGGASWAGPEVGVWEGTGDPSRTTVRPTPVGGSHSAASKTTLGPQTLPRRRRTVTGFGRSWTRGGMRPRPSSVLPVSVCLFPGSGASFFHTEPSHTGRGPCDLSSVPRGRTPPSTSVRFTQVPCRSPDWARRGL